ncbi:hypothetical protein B0H17DRAFT_1052444, partial [Mycena rosella]
MVEVLLFLAFGALGRAARPFGIQNLETGGVAWNCFQEPDLCAASRSNANDLATVPTYSEPGPMACISRLRR